MQTATFGIGGMHCAACAARNERLLTKLPGALAADVNFGTRQARVEFNQSTISERALHDAVIANGYQVLAVESAQDNKEPARRELQSARRRAFLALLLAARVTALAMKRRSSAALPALRRCRSIRSPGLSSRPRRSKICSWRTPSTSRISPARACAQGSGARPCSSAARG